MLMSLPGQLFSLPLDRLRVFANYISQPLMKQPVQPQPIPPQVSPATTQLRLPAASHTANPSLANRRQPAPISAASMLSAGGHPAVLTHPLPHPLPHLLPQTLPHAPPQAHTQSQPHLYQQQQMQSQQRPHAQTYSVQSVHPSGGVQYAPVQQALSKLLEEQQQLEREKAKLAMATEYMKSASLATSLQVPLQDAKDSALRRLKDLHEASSAELSEDWKLQLQSQRADLRTLVGDIVQWILDGQKEWKPLVDKFEDTAFQNATSKADYFGGMVDKLESQIKIIEDKHRQQMLSRAEEDVALVQTKLNAVKEKILSLQQQQHHLQQQHLHQQSLQVKPEHNQPAASTTPLSLAPRVGVQTPQVQPLPSPAARSEDPWVALLQAHPVAHQNLLSAVQSIGERPAKRQRHRSAEDELLLRLRMLPTVAGHIIRPGDNAIVLTDANGVELIEVHPKTGVVINRALPGACVSLGEGTALDELAAAHMRYILCDSYPLLFPSPAQQRANGQRRVFSGQVSRLLEKNLFSFSVDIPELGYAPTLRIVRSVSPQTHTAPWRCILVGGQDAALLSDQLAKQIGDRRTPSDNTAASDGGMPCPDPMVAMYGWLLVLSKNEAAANEANPPPLVNPLLPVSIF
eukprot:TRINITY_DN8005_c0_g1_i2.p1 TRINITY_DN8005_c0_g1~~TRINITY_DN8005_c0_g1_i2.p1  ORF type:complete len:739 (-),score=129.95 TRINITY_DN8005_c0_g1_i2:13-1905(-)